VTRSDCLSPDDCLGYLEGRPDAPTADETQRHLDDCDACRVMMAESVCATTTANGPVRPHALRTLIDGERLGGRYEIRRFVARGGMGEVYEAFDTVLKEPVALKTLALTASDREDAVEGLLREVRIARKVNHPNVCRILEVGIHRYPDTAAHTVPFLTMDFLIGETLAQRIARVGPLSTAESLQLTRNLAAGLGAIHAAGIVHRDFKSDNVFLVRGDDGSERAVVMDFGLARAAHGSQDGRSSNGQYMIGTAAYMAPEQLTGQPASSAADIYALGIVIFQMLTGRLPFTGDSPAAAALARLHQNAPKPSLLISGLDPNWNVLLERCLAREPKRRVARTEDIAVLLERLASAWPRRRQRRPGGAVFAWSALALTMTVAGTFWAVHSGERSPSAWRRSVVALSPEPLGTLSRPPPSPASTADLARRPEDVVTSRSGDVETARPTHPAARGKPSHPGVETVAEGRGQPPVSVAEPEQVAVRDVEPTWPAVLEASEELMADGRTTDACRSLERAQPRFTREPALYRSLGRCLMRSGRAIDAKLSYRRYLELAPDAQDAQFVREILR
jgi:serine/threonine protein kinase